MGSDQIMNSTLKYLGLLAILPLFTMALTTDYVIEEVDAATKSKGSDVPGRVGEKSYGSANKGVVCGDRLCSEYPGGYEQFQKDQGQSAKIGSESIEPKISEEKAMEDKMMEKKSMMKRGGSVYYLSIRTNYCICPVCVRKICIITRIMNPGIDRN